MSTKQISTRIRRSTSQPRARVPCALAIILPVSDLAELTPFLEQTSSQLEPGSLLPVIQA
jgi:hypothetical protein